MKFRNWIEAVLGQRIMWSPIYVGTRGGKMAYVIMLEDGSEMDVYIDFDAHTIEAC